MYKPHAFHKAKHAEHKDVHIPVKIQERLHIRAKKILDISGQKGERKNTWEVLGKKEQYKTRYYDSWLRYNVFHKGELPMIEIIIA